jgi:hypothetical protein
MDFYLRYLLTLQTAEVLLLIVFLKDIKIIEE